MIMGTVAWRGPRSTGAAAVGVVMLIKHWRAQKKAIEEAQKAIQGFEAQLNTTLNATQRAEAGNVQWKMTTIAVRDAYLATGRSAAEAEAVVKRFWDTKNPIAYKAAIDEITAVFNEQKQDAEDLQAAIERYGFSIEELGPAMQKQKLDEQAAQLINDWRLLVESGIDLTVVNEKMTKSVQEYLSMAKKTGMEVPAAMKPILQSMIDQGQLVDENGDAITDLGQLGVTFSESMTQGFDRIVKKLQELLDHLGMVPEALNHIPTPPPIHIGVIYDDPGPPQHDRGDENFAATGGLVTPSGIVPVPPQYLAGGGRVLSFRSRGTDTVPAMLTPGELVLSRQQARAYLSGRGGGAEPVEVHTHLYLDGREIAASTERVQMAQLRRERRLIRSV